MTLMKLLTALTALRQLADARHCAAVSATGEFFAFGTPAGDYTYGVSNTSSTTSSPAALPSTSGRPPFDSNNTQCFTGQYTNALYVLDGDSSRLSDVHIYDFAKRSWSVQSTTGKPSGDQVAILDHDTLTLYGYVNGSINALVFSGDTPAAASRAITWQNDASVNGIPFITLGYRPVLGAANNHIHFLNTPGTPAGDAFIFVIHFAYNQLEAQKLGDFPAVSGQTVSLLSNDSASAPAFAFFPDTFNGTYLINAESNTTIAYPAPPAREATARYAASQRQLFQVSASGQAAVLDIGSSAAWRNLTYPASLTSQANNRTSTLAGMANVDAAPSRDVDVMDNAAVSRSAPVGAGQWVAALVMLAVTVCTIK